MQRSAELGRAFDHPVQLLAQVYVGSGHYLGFCYDYPALAAELCVEAIKPFNAAGR